MIASLFSLGHLNEVIGSLIATRVLIQYLPQTMGFFLLRFRAPGICRGRSGCGSIPVPGIISIAGWIYVLGDRRPRSLLFAWRSLGGGKCGLLSAGSSKGEWPFAAQ